MKYKYTAALLSLTLCTAAFAVTGCSNTSKTSSSTDGEIVYGEVTEVGENSVTIDVGTKTETANSDDADAQSGDTAKSDSNSKDSNSTEEKSTDDSDSTKTDSADGDSEGKPDGQPGGVTLELTGESQTITVTDDTEITRESMGGPGGDMSGDEAPERPDGEAPDNSDGSAPENGSDDSSKNSDSSSTDASGDASDDSDSSSKGSEPEKPDGEPPEKPDGEASSGDSDGTEQTISLSDLSEGDVICVELDTDGNAVSITVVSGNNGAGMNGAGGGQSQGVDSYDAATEYTEDTEVDGEKIESNGTDENAIHAYNGAEVTLKNLTVTRDSSDSQGGDNSSFYGVGAAILETDGTAYISNTTIDTDAKGAAGAFAYGDGTVYIADTEIATKEDTSGGIHAAGGGTLYAWDVTATTEGESSAAIRSDRGGGTMVVDGGTYTSNGTGSPAIYSTADISVNDATLTANGSEALCIEGLNSARLFNCDLTGNMSDSDQNDCTWNVILYQSMSGDSEVGNSTFEMNGGSLTAKNGGMFYTTNTESTFILSDVDITYADDSDFFLRCTGNANERGWGTTGENGADCHFTGISQEMEGDVIWDSISQLDFYMTDGSTLTGAVTQDDTYANGGSGGYCNLYIDKDSTWIVTGDSTVTSLDCAGTIKDADGNTVTIKGSDGTVYVEGTSDYTITVDSYSTKGDVSDASTASSWSDYEVEKPSQLS